MVHPFLTTDPHDSRGKIGIINELKQDDKGYTDLRVKFPDGTSGLYEADALMILRSENTIRQTFISKIDSLIPDDRKELQQVMNLMKKGYKQDALKKAMGSDVLQSVCVTNCLDWIDHNQQRTIKLNNGLKR